MKKSLILLPILIISISLGGCNLQQNPQDVQEKNTSIETTPISQEKAFDSKKVKLVINEEELESYHTYEDIKEYNWGDISIVLGGQDWLTVSLLYKKWEFIQQRDIFRYGMWSDTWINKTQIVENNDLNNRPRCLDYTCGKQSVWDIKEIKVNCGNVDNDTDPNILDECINKIFEYTYNLIIWDEKNDYFNTEYSSFLSSL